MVHLYNRIYQYLDIFTPGNIDFTIINMFHIIAIFFFYTTVFWYNNTNIYTFCFNSLGKEPATSARPPVFTKGTASEATYKTFNTITRPSSMIVYIAHIIKLYGL